MELATTSPLTFNAKNTLIISRQPTPIVLPAELTINEQEFYELLLKTINSFQLPIMWNYCYVEREAGLPLHLEIVISLPEERFKLLRVFVGVDKIGSMVFVERKYVILAPDLPPAIDGKSPELPPRLSISSPELPQREPNIHHKSSPSGSPFKSEIHRQRVSMIEQRRMQRYRMIIQRQEENYEIVRDWSKDVDQVIEVLDDPLSAPGLRYLKDTIDIMIRIVVTSLEQRGATIKQVDEQVRKEEELREQIKEMRRHF